MRPASSTALEPVSPALQISGVSKSYRQAGQNDVVALAGIRLEVAVGEFVVIVGHNGSGKSTLLAVVAGSADADAGTVAFPHAATQHRRPRVVRVRQNPSDGTFEDLTVMDNFRLFQLEGPPSLLRRAPPRSVVAEARERLRSHNMVDKLERRVSELSQGQRQLLALELAMTRRPDVLLLDEHTASLDRTNAAACMDTTVRLARETNATVLMVTHNLSDALRHGDTLVVMRDGRIVERVEKADKPALSLEQLLASCGFVS